MFISWNLLLPSVWRSYVFSCGCDLHETSTYLVSSTNTDSNALPMLKGLGSSTSSDFKASWTGTPQKKDPSKLKALVPKWLFTHDPEKYVYDNYETAVKSLTDNTSSFTNTNVPPGSAYRPWTMDELLDDMRNNRQVEMEGDWS